MKWLFPVLIFALIPALYAQDSAAPAKQLEHVRGTVMSADKANHTVTVREDGGAAAMRVVDLKETKTLVKVAPGAKNLDGATRITADDLAVGDRVDVRYQKSEGDAAAAISARSVVLMSGRELQQVHQAEASAWQRSTAGVVASIDAGAQKLTVTARTPEGPKSISVDATGAQFTRYSPETPKVPKVSAFGEIQPGDQVKIIAENAGEGSAVKAQKIYSGTFKSVAGTFVSAAADGKSMVVKDLGTKQQVTVLLSNDASLHKLPPMMAYMLARRFNPDFKAPEGAAGPGAGGPGSAGRQGAPGPGGTGPGGPPAMGANPGAAAPPAPGEPQPTAGGNRPGGWSRDGGGPGGPGGPGGGPGMRAGSGDLGQMLDRAPTITLSDLKPGDAVVISGSPSAAEKTSLVAANVIAGVEPIFQSASPRQVQSLGDWGNSLGGGAMDAAGSQP